MTEKRIKGFYLHHRDIYAPHVCNGVDKKIEAQIKAFNKAGLGCEFLLYAQPSSTFEMVKSSLPGFPDGVEWPDANDLKRADYLYIRRPRITSKELIRVMEEYKRLNPAGIILYEIPTYPYDPEWLNYKMYLGLRKDRRNRKRLAGLVDRVVDLSGNDEIFGVPTLQVINGVDFERVSQKGPVSDLSTVNILCVAYFTRVHGADRVIRGLGDYYASSPKREVIFHIAGDGSVMSELRNLVKRYGIEGHVVFHGLLDGDELDDLYGECSIAVGILGLHRYGHATTSALKTREYLAKGIPFVYSGGVDVFDRDPVDFCLQVDADDSPLDVRRLIAFHDSLYLAKGQECVIREIRAYGESHVSMDCAMGEVTDYLKARLGA